MRHLRLYIILLIWFTPAVVFLCWIFSKDNVKEIKDGVYIIGNKAVEWELEVTEGAIRSNQLVSRKSGEKLPLSGTEFTLKAGYKKDMGWTTREKDPVYAPTTVRTITPEQCLPVQLKEEKNKVAFVFYYPALKLVLTMAYSFNSNDPFIRRALSVENMGDEEIVIEDAVLGNWISVGKITGGGIGLPVFVDDKWFITGEAPWFDARQKGNAIVLREYPSAFLKKGEKWIFDSVLVGGGKEGARGILSGYIKNVILSPKFVTVYNTWCDFRRQSLKSENVANTFLKLCDGLRPFGAKIDYCVVDDNWFKTSTVYQTNTDLFPNGLVEVSEAVIPYGSDLGLWLAYSSMMSDLPSLKKEGYEMANVYYACLSGEKYNAALKEAVKNRLTIDQVRCFKHDFNYFVCNRIDHGHLNSKEQSTEANMRKTAEMLDYERGLVPDLHQSITTGINHSPWWLKYAHILWMGGKDKDYDFTYPVTSRAQGEMRARDGLLYKQQVEDEEFFPLYALMTHGMINGLLDTAGPWLDDHQWADYIMNYLGRGTAFRELYIHPRELNEKKFEILGRGLHWAREHDALMLNSEMILGDPRKDEVYGFRGRDDSGHKYVSLRNPKFLDEEVKVADLGINSDYYRISYPYHMIRETKSYPTVKIPAESVMILESLELKDLTYPALINIRFQRNNITGSSARFVINSEGSDKNPIYLYSPFTVKRFLGLHNVIEVSKHLLCGERPGSQDIRRVKAEELNILSNAFSCSVSVPEGASSLLVWTINDKDAEISLTDNSVAMKPQLVSFPNQSWKVVMTPLARGEHDIMGTVTGSKRPITLMDLQLRSTYALPALELQLVHKVARGQNVNNYELPMPISQDELKETTSLFEKAKLTTAPRKVWHDVEEAVLSVDVFDVNGDAYTNKVVMVNDVPIGLLPNNTPPLGSWQTVSMTLPHEALGKIGNSNNVGIFDETGDAYKLRNVTLTVKRSGVKHPIEMKDSGTFCSSPTWALREGDNMTLDGSSFVILCE